jgi:hypothetical protein
MSDLTLRLFLSQIEDESLVNHLLSFKGHNRNRRARHLLRTGLAVIQGTPLPPQATSFPEPKPPSTSTPDQGESLSILANLGLNPLSITFAEGEAS